MLLPPGRRRSLFESRIVLAYLLGSASGALLTVLAAWVVSGFTEPLPGWLRVALLAAGTVLLWLAKEGPLAGRLPLPETRRQIPVEVFHRGWIRGAYRFGFEMGTGVRTYVPTVAPYVLLLALLLGRFGLGAAILIAIGFGIGRTVPLLVQFSLDDRLRFADALRHGAEPMAATAAWLIVLAGALALV